MKLLFVDENWPGHPVRTAVRWAIDWIRSFQYSLGAHEPTRATMPGSCAPGRNETVGKQHLLGFEAIGRYENAGDTRMTVWRAPQLGCFSAVDHDGESSAGRNLCADARAAHYRDRLGAVRLPYPLDLDAFRE
jgi:hypothetical protein